MYSVLIFIWHFRTLLVTISMDWFRARLRHRYRCIAACGSSQWLVVWLCWVLLSDSIWLKQYFTANLIRRKVGGLIDTCLIHFLSIMFKLLNNHPNYRPQSRPPSSWWCHRPFSNCFTTVLHLLWYIFLCDPTTRAMWEPAPSLHGRLPHPRIPYLHEVPVLRPEWIYL